MEISIKWNLCRTCLELEREDSDLSSIFSDAKLVSNIDQIAGIKVEPDDAMPQKICRKCVNMLKYAMTFRENCRNSDEYLRSVMQRAKSFSTLCSGEGEREKAAKIVQEELQEAFLETDDEEAIEVQKDAEPTKKRKTHHLNSAKKNSAQRSKSKQTIYRKVSAVDVGVAADLSNSEDETVERESSKIPKRTTILKGQYLEENVLEEHMEKDEPDIECLKEFTSASTQGGGDAVEQEQGDGFIEECEENSNGVSSLLQKDSEDFDKEHQLTSEEEDAGETYYVLSDEEIKRENDITTDFQVIQVQVGSCEENAETLINAESDGIEFQSLNNFDVIGDENETSESYIPRKSPPSSKSDVNDCQPEPKRKKVYYCEVCGNVFPSRSLVNCHMRMHRNAKEFECELCGKRFNAACNLTAHMRIHTGEKRYQCQYCLRRFTDRSTHIKHERIHTNEKPFVCGHCGKAFALSTTLRAHEKVHTGEKPHRCQPCKKAFKLPHQLKAHMKTGMHNLLVASAFEAVENEEN